MKRALPLLLLSLPAYAACAGDLWGSSSKNESSDAPDQDLPPSEVPASAHLDITPARLLTDLQYNNAIADLFGIHSAPLTAQIASHGDVYDNDASGLTSSPHLIEAFETAATQVASEAFQRGAVTFDCTLPDEATCIDAFIDRQGLRIFRRPPTADERAILTKLYNELRSPPIEDTPEQAAEGVLTAMLQMPGFLYHTAFGEGSGGQSRLTGFEIASRLSFALTNSTSDDELLQAAASGRLDTVDGVRAEAERLLDSPKARAGIFHFVAQWLGIEDVPRLNRDPMLFPTATTELGTAMYEETRLFFEDLFWKQGGSVADLYSADYSFINADLAGLYGVSGDFGAEFEKAPLPDERRGVLTQASYLAAHSVFDRSHPIARGVYMLRKILCFSLGTPPNNVGALPERQSEAETLRELLGQHREGACASCHQYIDPVGLTFESYDAIGAYRERYADGSPVETSAEVLLGDEQVFVEDGVAFSLALAESPVAASCFTEQALAYLLGRSPTRDDRATIERVARQSQSLKEIILNIVTSDPFLYRDVPAQEACE